VVRVIASVLKHILKLLVLVVCDSSRYQPTYLGTLPRAKVSHQSPNVNMDNSKPRLRLDAAGIFFVSWCGTWTLFVCAGMGFLCYRRDAPLLRIRNLNLSFVATAFLHTYWMAVQMSYIADPFPPQAEYWIMGIYLPFGIALFQASNSRFLCVAGQQRRMFTRTGYQLGERPRRTFFGRVCGLSPWLCHTRKMFVVIGMGMVLQVRHHRASPDPDLLSTYLETHMTQFFLTVLMYLLSKKFHPSFGVPGTEAVGSPWDLTQQQARGWEWYVLYIQGGAPPLYTADDTDMPSGGLQSFGSSFGLG
jgi:hypothetical protein